MGAAHDICIMKDEEVIFKALKQNHAGVQKSSSVEDLALGLLQEEDLVAQSTPTDAPVGDRYHLLQMPWPASVGNDHSKLVGVINFTCMPNAVQSTPDFFSSTTGHSHDCIPSRYD